jgi:hypothetical protein
MTLKDDDIVTTQAQTRRKFFGRVGGAVAVAVTGALAVITASSRAQAKDARDFIPKDNKARTPHDQNTRSGDITK